MADESKAAEQAATFEPEVVAPDPAELVNVPVQDKPAEAPPKVPATEQVTVAENRKGYAVLVNSVHTTLFESILKGNRKIPADEWKKLREGLDAGGIMLVEKYDKLGWLDKYLPELCYVLATGNVVAALLEHSPKKKKNKIVEDEEEETEAEEPENKPVSLELASLEELKKAYDAKVKQAG